jgi:hypothetical protein
MEWPELHTPYTAKTDKGYRRGFGGFLLAAISWNNRQSMTGRTP